ncbi:MAG: AAA family ATPase, partial [Candidatus Methanomethylophilaceae archaeon]|nr:AAA family ATPase [Candidatus Methanomethylophilaceae archaeon]
SKTPDIKVTSDMDWLIGRTRNYFERYGSLIKAPRKAGTYTESKLMFPKGTPTDEQKDAVLAALNNEISYIWGAPGTGKTKMVLAAAIMTLIKDGKNVLVMAPTNNAVENVMGAVMDVLAEEDPDGDIVDVSTEVLRVGTPSAPFVRKYECICEDRSIKSQINDLRNQVARMESLRAAFYFRNARKDLSVLKDLAGVRNRSEAEKKELMSQAGPYLSNLRLAFEKDPSVSRLIDGADEDNLRDVVDAMSKAIGWAVPSSARLEDVDPDALTKKIDEATRRISELTAMDTVVKSKTSRLLAMTPQTLMGRFSPVEDPDSGLSKLSVDHIFIDEVGYCNVLQALPLFAFDAPVTMLGDHMQLPPVCEIDDGLMIDANLAYLSGNENDACYALRFTFMWSQPAMFAERFLSGDVKKAMIDFNGKSNPPCLLTERRDLTESHRFGPNLGTILDECVYKNGVKGISESPLEIVCVDVRCPSRRERTNEAEAAAVVRYLKERPPGDSFAVLAPYKKQIKALWKLLPDFKDVIMNVHQSQGLEWDTVILSVCDNGAEIVTNSGNLLQFTSTVSSSMGARVINTAVSRAKKRLVLVCDRTFWTRKEGELIGRMAAEADVLLEWRG